MYGHPVHNHHATKVSMLMWLLNLVFFIMQCYEMGFRLKTEMSSYFASCCEAASFEDGWSDILHHHMRQATRSLKTDELTSRKMNSTT